MSKNIAKMLVLLSALFVMASCDITGLTPNVEVAPNEQSLRDNGMDTDYDFTYGLREFMQFSPKNPMGINLMSYYDFFDTFRLKIYVVKGQISALEITNGDIPCNQFGFALPAGKVDCYYDETAVPHAIRLKTGETIAVMKGGELEFPFVLDCQDLSYRMRFTTLDSTREK